MARKGRKKASAQNQAYKLENRHKTNKLKTMRRTLKNQPNNKELSAAVAVAQQSLRDTRTIKEASK